MTFFPIYDWRFDDLWRYTAEHGHAYNHLYDLMYRAGVPFSQMRICQPYGDDQRKGLDLFHKLEPATWFRVVRRVAGANYAARYSRQRFLGYRGGLGLPPTLSSWQQYCDFLLRSMPAPLRQVYERRIGRFIQWWEQHDYPLSRWPDAGAGEPQGAAILASRGAVVAQAGHGPFAVVRFRPAGYGHACAA